MNTIRTLVRHARRTFPHTDYTDPANVRSLRRKWVRAIVDLGPRWVCAQTRKLHEKRDAVVLAVTAAGTLPLLAADVVARFA